MTSLEPPSRKKYPASTIIISVVLAALAFVGTTIWLNTHFPKTQSSQAALTQSQRMDKYVAFEQASIPQLMAANPGLYKSVQVDGRLDGATAVVTFTYTFTGERDYPGAAALLDAQTSSLEATCQKSVFPELRTSGLNGPVKVTFVYDAEQGSPDGKPIWSHTCTLD